MSESLGIIGAGNMAEAIVRSALDEGVLSPDGIAVADPSDTRRAMFESLGVAFFNDNASVIQRSTQVMLAVKPQVFPLVVPDLQAGLTGEHVLMSIMAGLRTAKMIEAIGRAVRLVRVMPNTPVMAGVGMAGIALGQSAKPGDDALAYALFTAGRNAAVRVDEDQLDAVTAVSGSGPAYLFYLAEAMEQAAEQLGLGDAKSLFVSQTLLGAATLLAESDDTPAELRRKVTSPNGTTQAACEHMDAQGVMQAIAEAVGQADARSRELGA